MIRYYVQRNSGRIMSGVIRVIARLYPRRWRERYGDEFAALLEDTGSSAGIVGNVLAGAITMQMEQAKKAAGLTILALLSIFAASRWAAHSPRITPGLDRTYYMDSTPGALLEFLVLLMLLGGGLLTVTRVIRSVRGVAGIAGSYLGAVILFSLLTPQTIVSVGDNYCWDMWCAGIQNVRASAQGANTVYTLDVSVFADSTEAQRVPAEAAKRFFYVMDEQGRRFPIERESSFANADVILQAGESLKSRVTFAAPAGARRLYLTGDMSAPWWVRLYLGSDLNPFHRRTLLRIA